MLILPMTAATVLFARGGYLALAGHRPHLYESNDRLTAHLAGLIRPQPAEPPAAAPVNRLTAPAPATPVGAVVPSGNGLQTTEART